LRPYYHHRLKEYYQKHQTKLNAHYPGVTPQALCELLEQLAPSPDLTTYNDLIDRLAAGHPLSYISGEHYFFSSTFKVTPNVLIPRFESEILVSEALKVLPAIAAKSIVEICEIGCGSGALILSLMVDGAMPLAAVATDISPHSVEVTAENWFRLQYKIDPKSTLTLQLGDRLTQIDKRFQLIISNPPYIKQQADRDAVHSSVLAHEPHQALFIPDDEYQEWFATLFSQVYDHLYPGGIFLMEGHERHLRELSILLENCGFGDIAILCDLNKRERVVRAIRS
jgi:release factor glutamine methyltransferase